MTLNTTGFARGSEPEYDVRRVFFSLLRQKEAGKRSASKLMDTQGADSASSSYRRNKNVNRSKSTKSKVEAREVCSYCGKTGHGVRAPPHVRQKERMAYGQRVRNVV